MSGNVQFRWLLLASIVLSFLTSCASTGTLDNTSSTLQINTSNVATGTGFLFSSSDYVITSYHVVHGAKSIRVRLVNGERIDATVALKDTNNDIAILKLSQSPTSRQSIIILGDSSSVKTGDRVFTYGFPLVDLLGDAEPRYSEGFINSLSGISNDPRLFQVSIPIQPGNSGGPVFNEKGELIGIATSSIDSVQTQKVFGATPQNVNFAIKSSYINSLLPNLPDTFIRKKGIVVVPAEEVGFKERVKNDIVLVEAVPEFKPTVVKRDYEGEGRLSEEREREVKLEGGERAKCVWEREYRKGPGEVKMVCNDYSGEPRVQGYELCPLEWHDKFVAGVYSEGESRNKEQVRSGICVHNTTEGRQCKAGQGCRNALRCEQCLWDLENVYLADMYGEAASWYPCDMC
jgi:hypothetical protein